MVAESSAKIAIFLPSLRGGGAEKAMLLFAEGLIDFGYKVDIVLVEPSGALLSTIPAGVNLVNLNQKRVLTAIPKLVTYLRKTRPTALYSTVIHTNVAAIVSAALARTGTPVIVRESNVPKTAPAGGLTGKIVLKLLPWVYSLAHGIIAVSDGVKEELISLNPKLADIIQVLPTPVVSEKILNQANLPADHPWLTKDEKPFLLAIGRLHPQKDFQTLLTAFAEIRKSKDIRLIILGEGNERAKLELLAQDLGIQEQLSMPGFVINPFPFMAKAATFILSSRYEGMPNVLVQAMACGAPVVATDCKSGPREVLCDGKFGILTPVGDPLSLADAILKSLEVKDTDEGRAYAKKEFGVEQSVKKYLGLLETQRSN